MTPKPRNATRRTGPLEEEFAGSVTCGSFQGRERKLDYPSDAGRPLRTRRAERELICRSIWARVRGGADRLAHFSASSTIYNKRYDLYLLMMCFQVTAAAEALKWTMGG